MSLKSILFLLIFASQVVVLSAQCNSEYYYKAGAQVDESMKILEDTLLHNTFVFWGSPRDTNDTSTQVDRDIWVIKNDNCGNRLWKKNIGFDPGISGDFFVDAIFTIDSNIIILGDGFYMDQGEGTAELYSSSIKMVMPFGKKLMEVWMNSCPMPLPITLTVIPI
jgi:hypothetical protein